MTTEDIDKIICAEIPDKVLDPLAYQTVVKFMIHGPYDVYNPNSPCVIEVKCSKCYPKSFCVDTIIDDDGFVTYRRRQIPESKVIINGVEIDSRWVVPYNRDIIVLFDAHINFEKVGSPKLMKYMYKYLHKGVDMATIVIQNKSAGVVTDEQTMCRQVDEVKQYLDCRYVSAIESCWRIFDFDLQSHNPPVMRLRFHLKDQQFVIFNEHDNLNDIVNREHNQHTMLTKWFEVNRNNNASKSMTYVEFPNRWVWRQDTKQWRPRTQGYCISRLFYVHPSANELYYLRMLLYKVRGAESFEDIRTYNGIVYPTYKQACAARGLLEDDNEWNEALNEAACWASANNLRHMFCSILMFSEVTNPESLWEQHWKSMVDDLQYTLQREMRSNNVLLSDTELKDMGLHEIDNILIKNGKTLADFPPMPLPSSCPLGRLTNRYIREELNYNIIVERQSFNSYFLGLNSDQLRVYNAIIHAYEQEVGGFFFVNGSGGTRKTYLWKTLIAGFKSRNKIVLSVASSGIASLLLPGGRTAHSRFKIPMELHESSNCHININSDLAQLIREASLIIWDEAPMMHRHGFEALNRTLTDLLKKMDSYSSQMPFGGKLVVLGGDFKQILPVVTKGRREAVVAASLHKSELWSSCQIMHLQENMRLTTRMDSTHSFQTLRGFADWIKNIGEGKIPNVNFFHESESDWIEIPETYLIPNNNSSLSQLLDFVYPQLTDRYVDCNYFKERAILAPKNSDVDEINSMMLSILPGEIRQYSSADKLCPSDTNDYERNLYPPEMLNSLKISGFPDHILDLKEGAPIILLRNLNQYLGLCNGTRLIITKMGEKVL